MKNNIAVCSLCIAARWRSPSIVIAAMFFRHDQATTAALAAARPRITEDLLCIAAMFLRQLEASRSPLAPLYYIEGSSSRE